jgi:hypothetical protein
LKEHPAKLQYQCWAQLAIFIAIKTQTSSKLKRSADWPVYAEQH